MPVEDLLDVTLRDLILFDFSMRAVAAYSRLRFSVKKHDNPFNRMLAVQT